ncbi:MAG: hypothetical protein JWO52_3799 [Gammaproteobacteria bacterium]|jgi:hypothetical protein|nr:hypothetical protein [Gammaproteobacteria bacterium]
MPLRALTYVSNGAVAPASDDDGPAAPPPCFSLEGRRWPCAGINATLRRMNRWMDDLGRLTYVIFGQAELMIHTDR